MASTTTSYTGSTAALLASTCSDITAKSAAISQRTSIKGSGCPADLYATLMHELSHHSEIRVGYDHAKHGYAMTELVAEISGCLLCQELQVPQSDGLQNHVAYLKSWLDAMKGDSSFIFKASSFASKITDYLLARAGRVVEPEPVGAGQEG